MQHLSFQDNKKGVRPVREKITLFTPLGTPHDRVHRLLSLVDEKLLPSPEGIVLYTHCGIKLSSWGGIKLAAAVSAFLRSMTFYAPV